jgi:hypothetical protein
MATPRKRTAKPKTVADESYSVLETYCIWLNEYYKALRKSGFSTDNSLWLVATKESFPDWVDYKAPTELDIQNLLDEDED